MYDTAFHTNLTVTAHTHKSRAEQHHMKKEHRGKISQKTPKLKPQTEGKRNNGETDQQENKRYNGRRKSLNVDTHPTCK